MKKSAQVYLAFFLVVVSYLLYGCPNVPPYGSLTLIITPPGAISAGAQWRVDQGMWKKSSGIVHGLSLGEHTVSFSSVGGWISPQDQIVTIMPNKNNSASGTYLELTAHSGSIQVFIEPAEAVTAGAQWQIDNGSWQDSGAVLEGLPQGKHIINFSAAYKWVKADSELVTIDAAIPASVTGTYTPFSTSYVVFGYNDLGMHCMNEDFSELMILPPYNNLYAQVVERSGEKPRIVSSDLTITYDISGNTTSADKTNFWDYAEQLFAVSLPDNEGLTGNGLSGSMDASGRNDWVATGIPITPINDAGMLDPYSMAAISVRQGGVEVARTHAVVPVSWEIRCDLCHLPSEGNTVETNILSAHDDLHGTTLMNERPVVCGACHAQPELNLSGDPDVATLSSAMHSAHAPRMLMLRLDEPCYACHPGLQTQCLRDVHYSKGITCTSCHKSMAAVGNPGRRPWVDLPRCENCHRRAGFEFEQHGTLYRDSKGHMGIHCEVCHGSPHAITHTLTRRDNEQAISMQGTAGIIDDCKVCHMQTPDDPFPHRIGESDQ